MSEVRHFTSETFVPTLLASQEEAQVDTLVDVRSPGQSRLVSTKLVGNTIQPVIILRQRQMSGK